MNNYKGKKLIRAELILIVLQALAAFFGNFIHQRFMSDGATIIIKKFNFVSPMTWGYGNFFPVLFLASLLIAGLILLNAHRKLSYMEDRLSSNIVIFGGILFLMVPLVINLQQINLGLILMVVVQFVIFAMNMVRTRN
ncbi:hypothetical protein [uncultured Anaerococcus sp.]|uniref:hypothetical protein n=1 Tax=uncultured Anaerococcus sp. TaxID=293428 RepID=UPI00288C44E1|nr:hypothetical protein [uncultured Anaerococcus sp.]